MDFSLTDDQQNVRDAVLRLCAGFPDDYWLELAKKVLELPESS